MHINYVMNLSDVILAWIELGFILLLLGWCGICTLQEKIREKKKNKRKENSRSLKGDKKNNESIQM